MENHGEFVMIPLISIFMSNEEWNAVYFSMMFLTENRIRHDGIDKTHWPMSLKKYMSLGAFSLNAFGYEFNGLKIEKNIKKIALHTIIREIDEVLIDLMIPLSSKIKICKEWLEKNKEKLLPQFIKGMNMSLNMLLLEHTKISKENHILYFSNQVEKLVVDSVEELAKNPEQVMNEFKEIENNSNFIDTQFLN